MSRTVGITGASGLIGHYLLRSAPHHWRAHAAPRNPDRLSDWWKEHRPELVIHCAALSKAAACEKDPELARKSNVELTRQLCELVADAWLIFFSTDLVFDGSKGNYSETDAVNPLTVYGRTKAEAERIVLANPRHTVIRVSLNAGVSPTGDRAFNEEIHNAWRKGEMLKLFTDEFRTPIPAAVTARATWELAEKQATGLFHLGGTEKLSRWDIGQLLAERWKDATPKMAPGSVGDYKGPLRSPDTSLDCAKVQKWLSFPLPRLSEWLRANPHEPI
ncbi:MAG TPA: SDR family oxidoreductase [Candidatus Binatia bacterium]|nr:SDR family oxidoreductase [Candidatus Binatia bacterium]